MNLPTTFQAMVVRVDGKSVTRAIETRQLTDLPPGNVVIRVRYSALNYKDALSASGNKGVTRSYPHTPGIDAAGVVIDCDDGSWERGAEVVVTGHDLGMNTAGGFGELIRVPGDWVVPLPAGLSLRQSMILGTAGFTAAQCLQALVDHGISGGELVVTGASGGVGSLATALAAQAGFRVCAVTGSAAAGEFLQQLGAAEILSRESVDDHSGKPLLGGRWAGGIDTVGGNILATVIKSVAYRGAVACCGLVASPDLSLTVFPFILRGVALFGIDSAACPAAPRRRIWDALAGAWRLPDVLLETIATPCTLADLDRRIDDILAGRTRGRMLIEMPS